jgi:HEAT repeat protein
VPDLSSLIADLASGDDLRAENARLVLASLGTAALPAVVDLIHSPHADHRWWAVRCLADLPHVRADRLLVDALDDPSTLVRQAAALALRDRPLAAAAPRLVALLASEDGLLARLASDALAALGSVGSSALAEAVRSGSAVTRIGAARALALNEDPDAAPALFAALDDPSAMVEYWAAEGLERRGLGMVYFSP